MTILRAERIEREKVMQKNIEEKQTRIIKLEYALEEKQKSHVEQIAELQRETEELKVLHFLLQV